MEICQVCQHQNPSGVEYCEECGAALGAPSAGVPTAPPITATAKPAPVPLLVAAAPVSAPVPASGGTGATDTSRAGEEAAGAMGTQVEVAQEGAAGAAAGGQPRLVVKRYGALTQEEIPLMGERLVVGRFDPETGPVDVDLSSIPETEHISRQHGELYREADGTWFVRDLGSTNGVFVKGSADSSFGQRISAPRQIGNGDEVAFGNARFLFRTE